MTDEGPGYDLDAMRKALSVGLRIESVSELSGDQAVQLVGELIDAADLLGEKEGLVHALKLVELTLEKELTPIQEARLNYFAGNAFFVLDGQGRQTKDLSDAWSDNWERPEIEPAI